MHRAIEEATGQNETVVNNNIVSSTLPLGKPNGSFQQNANTAQEHKMLGNLASAVLTPAKSERLQPEAAWTRDLQQGDDLVAQFNRPQRGLDSSVWSASGGSQAQPQPSCQQQLPPGIRISRRVTRSASAHLPGSVRSPSMASGQLQTPLFHAAPGLLAASQGNAPRVRWQTPVACVGQTCPRGTELKAQGFKASRKVTRSASAGLCHGSQGQEAPSSCHQNYQDLSHETGDVAGRPTQNQSVCISGNVRPDAASSSGAPTQPNSAETKTCSPGGVVSRMAKCVNAPVSRRPSSDTFFCQSARHHRPELLLSASKSPLASGSDRPASQLLWKTSSLPLSQTPKFPAASSSPARESAAIRSCSVNAALTANMLASSTTPPRVPKSQTSSSVGGHSGRFGPHRHPAASMAKSQSASLPPVRVAGAPPWMAKVKVPRSATVPQLRSAQVLMGQVRQVQVPDKALGDPQWWQCCVRKLHEFRCCFQMCYTPTIFGTIAVDKTPAEHKRKQQRQSVGPQTVSLSQMFDMAGSGYVGNNRRFTSDQALIFQNGNLLSGSLESLIQHLVPTSDYYPDRTYIFAFLLSSRLFITTNRLFAEVCQLCVYQQNLSLDTINRDSLGKFGPHIVRLISEWTELFPYDFRDERMMKHMRDLTQRVISIYPELRKDISSVMHALLTRLSKLDVYENSLSKLSAESVQKAQSQTIPTTDIMEVCPSPMVLAQQLTHVELERLSMIGPEEFIQAFCKEKIEAETTFADMKMTHNLESYVQWFNHLSYFIATEICSHLKKKNRVRMLEYFIDVAKECINIGNFNSLMAIIAGINMSPVARLKKTWAKLNTAKFDILEHQMDPSNNFGIYRSCLKAAMWRAQCASNDRERVVIPFFSLFVKDLYFLNEGCTNRMADGNVNFEKCWLLAKQVSDLIAWQQVECPYEKNVKVMHYVETLPVFSETTLSLASYECEQPENHYDKERHKTLKSQAGL